MRFMTSCSKFTRPSEYALPPAPPRESPRLRAGLRNGRSGQAVIMVTLMLSSLLLPVVGLAIDGGRAYLVRIKLSTAVDGASLAAGRLLPPTGLAFVWNTIRDCDMVTIGTMSTYEAEEDIELSLAMLERRKAEVELQTTRSKRSLMA